jgi:hypothetical protein
LSFKGLLDFIVGVFMLDFEKAMKGIDELTQGKNKNPLKNKGLIGQGPLYAIMENFPMLFEKAKEMFTGVDYSNPISFMPNPNGTMGASGGGSTMRLVQRINAPVTVNVNNAAGHDRNELINDVAAGVDKGIQRAVDTLAVNSPEVE